MTSYIIRRVLMGLLVVWLVTLLIFVIMRVIPGDPIRLYLGDDYYNYSPTELQELLALYDLDKPLPAQYFLWLGDLFQGDLGYSILKQRPVSSIVNQAIPVTFNLAVFAFIFSSVIGIAFGSICALNRGKWADSLFSVIANLGITLPIFWVGIMLIYLLSLRLGWLPPFGYTRPWEDFGLHIQKLIMPVFCMSLFAIGSLTRQTRSSMLEVIQQDYIRTAWAKGLRERTIIIRHMVKNSLIPVVTQMGLQARFLFGGALLVEVVFAIPGLGRMMQMAVMGRDYAVVQGGVFITALLIIVINIIIDIAYAWLDPRIRYN